MFKVTDAGAPSTYAGSIAPSQGSSGLSFREVLSTAQATDPDASGDASAMAALNAALSQFGISVPPALRITSGPDGLELSGDQRNDKFQAMLRANPAVQNTLNGMIGQESAARRAALSQVVSDFQGKWGNGMASFLDGFVDSEKNDVYSVSYNGAKVSVDEMGKNGWQPVKDGDDFTADLIAAYTHYQVTHAATVEKQKDKDNNDSDAALQLRSKLADALKQSQGVAG